MAELRVAERRFLRAMGRALSAQRRRVRERLAAPILQPFDMGFWEVEDALLADAIYPALLQAFVEGADETLDQVTSKADFLGTINELAIEWARDYSFRLVRGINATTRAAIERAVTGFFNRQNVTLGDTMDRLSGLFGPKRAEMIAVTEVTRAVAEGGRRTVQQIEASGFRMVPIWRTRNDERTCPICGPRHNTRQGAGWTDYPPAHPRCRCTVVYRIDDTKAVVMDVLREVGLVGSNA